LQLTKQASPSPGGMWRSPVSTYVAITKRQSTNYCFKEHLTNIRTYLTDWLRQDDTQGQHGVARTWLGPTALSTYMTINSLTHRDSMVLREH